MASNNKRDIIEANRRSAMPPPPPRPPKQPEIVLEEDEWTAKLEAIIERDFFPELPDLQLQVQWLEALRTGDPDIIQQAQLNIQKSKHKGNQTEHTSHHPLEDPTPLPPGEYDDNEEEDRYNDHYGDQGNTSTKPPPVSLDTFVASHTSEDNASFTELLEKTNARRRAKAQATGLLPPPPPPPSSLQQSQPSLLLIASLQPTKHTPVNALMYPSSQSLKESLPLTVREREEREGRVGGAPKAINHQATRFNPHLGSSNNGNRCHNMHGMFSSGDTSVASISTTTSEASSPFRHHHHYYQYGGVHPARYGIVETLGTNPATVEATPTRLGDERGGEGGGGGFEMKGPRPREAAGLALAAQIAIKKRKLQQHPQMSFGGTPCGIVPSPSSSASPWHNNNNNNNTGGRNGGGGGSTSERRAAAAAGAGSGLGSSVGRHYKRTGSATLSPAAQRLAGELLLQKNKKNKGGGGGGGGGSSSSHRDGGDVGLRASYGGGGGSM